MTDNTEITLYTYTFPSRADRVVWMLNELELDYALKRLDPIKGETRTPEFKALNPNRKVPVLVHNNNTIIETTAIMEYLHGLKPEKNMVPSDPGELNYFRQMIYFMLTELESYLWVANQSTTLKAIYPWPEGSFELAIKLAGRNMRYLSDQIGGKDFLVGDHFTIADIIAHQLIRWAGSTKMEISDNGLRYIKSLESRPGFISNK